MHFLGENKSIKAKLWMHTGVQRTPHHSSVKVLLYVFDKVLNEETFRFYLFSLQIGSCHVALAFLLTRASFYLRLQSAVVTGMCHHHAWLCLGTCGQSLRSALKWLLVVMSSESLVRKEDGRRSVAGHPKL